LSAQATELFNAGDDAVLFGEWWQAEQRFKDVCSPDPWYGYPDRQRLERVLHRLQEQLNEFRVE